MELFSDIWHSLIAICSAITPSSVAIFLIIVLSPVGTWIFCRQLMRDYKRRHLVKVAGRIIKQLKDELDSVRRAYVGKYMPLGLVAELKAAHETMITLYISSYSLSSELEIVSVANQVAVALAGIRARSARPMNAVEHEANRLVLVAELARLEADKHEKQAALRKTYQLQLELLREKWARERKRIAKSQKLLAACVVS